MTSIEIFITHGSGGKAVPENAHLEKVGLRVRKIGCPKDEVFYLTPKGLSRDVNRAIVVWVPSDRDIRKELKINAAMIKSKAIAAREKYINPEMLTVCKL